MEKQKELSIEVFQKDVTSLQKEVAELSIVDSGSQQTGFDILAKVRKFKKGTIEHLKEYCLPFKKVIDKAKGDIKQVTEPLDDIDEILSGKLNGYKRKLNEEQKKIEEKAKKRIEKAVENNKPIPAIPTPVVEKTVRSENSTGTYIDNWKAEVTDKQTLIKYALENGLTELIDINMSGLNKLAKIKKDNQDIPGVRFFNKPYLNTRL